MAVTKRRRRRGGRSAMHPNATARRAAGRPTSPAPASNDFGFPVPPSLAGPKRVFLNCHYCGYSPSSVPVDLVCPKCGGHSWERFAIPTRLLPKSLR